MKFNKVMHSTSRRLVKSFKKSKLSSTAKSQGKLLSKLLDQGRSLGRQQLKVGEKRVRAMTSGKRQLNHRLTFLGGVGLGSLAMYLFDPERGMQRLTAIRDGVLSMARQGWGLMSSLPGKAVSMARDSEGQISAIRGKAVSMARDSERQISAIRGKVVSMARLSGDTLTDTGNQLKDRAGTMVAETKSRVKKETAEQKPRESEVAGS